MIAFDIRPLAAALLLCLLATACASSESSSGGAQLTPEAALPEAHATTWRAWCEEADEWPELRPTVANDPALANFFVDNLVRVMVKSFDRSVIAQRGELPGPFGRARRELVYLAPHSAPVMIELVVTGDGVVAFLAADILCLIDDPRWTLPVATRLGNSVPESRRRLAELLERLPHARSMEDEVIEALGRAALEDPEWFVRAQAVLAIGARAAASAELTRCRAVLSRALVDPDTAVVQAACKALGDLGDRRAIPALINCIERLERYGTDVASLRAAQGCLERLAGGAFARDAAGWRAWWRENRS